ncbi:hypothetical protein QUH73_00525 [Labilibaculum sp. K2S]|uniref:hypothetical protein n=1 Tax=Labilibaculum sp. K2S TaxID=3056386 RepID=UPI0025A3CB01|nr:hypothetical protein [Labilibaculum sp. K2S]MDM8158286.1 hypothetical protein [Labilibaculum sp. K2S]
MKKFLFIAVIAFGFIFESQAQTVQYKVITSVESIVPMGIGRSRLIEEKDTINAADFTTERTDGKKSKQKDVKRSDAKVDKFAETKLLNFYSIAGINFQNIASNDALTSSKINQLSTEGWELVFVTSGVESDSGKGDGNGIYITRYIFKKVI